jgi:hypothetical protein
VIWLRLRAQRPTLNWGLVLAVMQRAAEELSGNICQRACVNIIFLLKVNVD